ncbi:MAG: class I SAM-dependent methyltransferase [Acidobacteria bacterium]|nr:class I SAM-dependent methyltransferase [Acidobacteriota bacterium]
MHPAIIRKIGECLGITEKLPCALDIGCGAGLSTAALEPLAEFIVGIEPIPAMLAYCSLVAPTAEFVVAQAERLPFAARTFDLITAAGSVNYANLDLFFPEVERVLTETGGLVIYDFSAGRRVANDDRLERWYAEFKRRYPPQPGYALDVTALNYGKYGLRLSHCEPLEVALPMTFDSYLVYVLSETSIEQAIQNGTPETEIRDWCQHTLAEVFADGTREVIFDAYLACIARSFEK